MLDPLDSGPLQITTDRLVLRTVSEIAGESDLAVRTREGDGCGRLAEMVSEFVGQRFPKPSDEVLDGPPAFHESKIAKQRELDNVIDVTVLKARATSASMPVEAFSDL